MAVFNQMDNNETVGIDRLIYPCENVSFIAHLRPE